MYILKTHWYGNSWCVFLKFGKENVMERVYIAIDLKSFYASVECVERESDPLTTNLVVADESRTAKTICLAVTPSLKKYGLSGRSRLFEVEQKAKMRRSVIAARDLKAGQVLTADDLDAKRPGTGISPDRIDSMIGMTVTRDITADELLKESDIK